MYPWWDKVVNDVDAQVPRTCFAAGVLHTICRSIEKCMEKSFFGFLSSSRHAPPVDQGLGNINGAIDVLVTPVEADAPKHTLSFAQGEEDAILSTDTDGVDLSSQSLCPEDWLDVANALSA